MLFTLEALRAKHGDSLILHYGPPEKPSFIVIDGGPSGVYNNSLKPRLLQVKEKWSPTKALPLGMIMVSHLDDDHINGVLQMTGDVLKQKNKGHEPDFDIEALWNNTFDDLIGNAQDAAFEPLAAHVQDAGAVGALPAGVSLSQPGLGVIASVGQGRTLRDHAEGLDLRVNDPFPRLVQARAKGKTVVELGDGLKFTVIGPREARIKKLWEEWDKELEKLKKAGKLGTQQALAEAAAYVDKSVFNLSSIVVLAECGGKRMLLSGDARGDHILEGFEAAKLLTGGKLHVDLLKLPHHGSNRNVELKFFQQVTADHYVVSGDGEYGNPDTETLEMISEARGGEMFTLHLTYRTGVKGIGPRLEKHFGDEKKKGKKYGVVFREDDILSLRVDLLDPVTY